MSDTSERVPISMRLPKHVHDKLKTLAKELERPVTQMVIDLILAAAKKESIGAPTKKRANAAARPLAYPCIYRGHPSGPVYVSWAGYSRLGYIHPQHEMFGDKKPVRTDRGADAWAERHPVGAPEEYEDPLWVMDRALGRRVPPTPDPDRP